MKPLLVHVLVVAMTAAIFVADLHTPWGVATWILYAVPMFLLCHVYRERYVYAFAAVVTGLIVLDHFLSAPAAPVWFSLFNRAAGLVALWTAALLLVRRERAHRELQHCRARLEAAVEDGEARHRAVLEQSSDIALVFDEAARIRYASPAAHRLLGYAMDEMIGQSILAFVHPEDAPAATSELARARAHPGEIPSTEHRLRHKNGEYLWFESVGRSLLGDPAVRGIVVNARRIDERKEAERRRIEALERQRDALVREVHHRIKNSLQGVVGLLQEHARGHPELSEPMRAAIARVSTIGVIHGLQATGGSGRLNLSDVVDAIGQYKKRLYPEIAVSIERPAGWREVQLAESEAVAVALVVNELALNAIKACLREQCKVPVRISLGREGTDVCVKVLNAVGRLPGGFDFESGRVLGTGLTLVKSLLPPQGARLAIMQLQPAGVEARLVLSSPVILET